MKVFNSASLWGRFSGISLGIIILGALAACGGGGSSTESPVPDKTINSASISVSKILKAGDLDLTSPVTVDAKITSSYSTSGDVGTVTAVVKTFICDASPVTVTATVARGKVSYTNGNLPFGANCNLSVKLTGSVTGADGGYPTSEMTYAFTTSPAPKVFHYTMHLTVFADSTLGRIVPDASATGGYRSLALVNKTAYTTGARLPLALCATVWDGLLMHKQADGSPVVTCVTPAVGNLRRYFVVNPDTNEIGAEVPAPANVTLRDVAYGASPYEAQGIGAFSRFTQMGADVLYIINTDSVHLRLAPGGNFAKAIVINDSDGHEGYKSFWDVSN